VVSKPTDSAINFLELPGDLPVVNRDLALQGGGAHRDHSRDLSAIASVAGIGARIWPGIVSGTWVGARIRPGIASGTWVGAWVGAWVMSAIMSGISTPTLAVGGADARRLKREQRRRHDYTEEDRRSPQEPMRSSGLD
jgi:hypothetical protein